MKWALIFDFVAIIQWLFLTKAIIYYSSLGVSPFLDLGYCLLLVALRYHQSYWENKLQVARYLNQYL